MALTERNVIGKIEVLEDGQIQLREDTVIERDGVEVSRIYHRRVLEPGVAVASERDVRIQSIAEVIWTPDVIAAYEEDKRKRQNTTLGLIK